ncbi:hypothetical protein ENSA7_81670 [Enhygromyxa salina]|uniref:Uncharacterized protein n=1 Tax=Enhygromyxa salina TaxID=215803 RepID=A0A2S9XHC2_9BACT|nr:hypothetical protein ENSA7_81670 [Enhygromyxa salina]
MAQQPVELVDREAALGQRLDLVDEFCGRARISEGIQTSQIGEVKEARDREPKRPRERDATKQRGEVGERERVAGQVGAHQQPVVPLADPEPREHARKLGGGDRLRWIALADQLGAISRGVERRIDRPEILGEKAPSVERPLVIAVPGVDHVRPERGELVPAQADALAEQHDLRERSQPRAIQGVAEDVAHQHVEHAPGDLRRSLEPHEAVEPIERGRVQEGDRGVLERAGLRPLHHDVATGVDEVQVEQFAERVELDPGSQ